MMFPTLFLLLLLLVIIFSYSRMSAFVIIAPHHHHSSYDSSSSSRPSTLFASSQPPDSNKKIPIHLLTGFLGSGKTTVLQNLLENTADNMKIGVIVNDVASINIDAKLIKRRDENNNNSQNNNIIQLENGCACCSLGDEFVSSIDALLHDSTSSSSGSTYDCIVVELSGVADPTAIQNLWNDAIRQDSHPATTTQARLGNVITLLDSSTFGSDYLTFDTVKQRQRNTNNNNDSSLLQQQCNAYSRNKQIAELMCEQIEAADVLILNKMDLCTSERQRQVAVRMSRALNRRNAVLVATEYGKVSSQDVLLLVKSNGGNATTTKQQQEACDDPDCITDSSSTTTSHHSHAHHDHHHDHHATPCDDPDCTDKSHDHSHQHQHQHTSKKTSTDALGITNFVYKATKPFDSRKIQKLLWNWPIPTKHVLDWDMLLSSNNNNNGDNNNTTTTNSSNPFEGLLRSKGFCWFAPMHWNTTTVLADPWRHDTVMYWSSAGKMLNVQPAGTWWACINDDAAMRDFFISEQEYERVKREDFVSTEFGDRRQELVFIGVDLDQARIRQALDDCLLTDEEMEEYRDNLKMAREQMMMAAAGAAAADGGDEASSS